MMCSLLKAFFRPEVVNRPQTGLTVVGGEKEPCVE